jgi:hypothetical protein
MDIDLYRAVEVTLTTTSGEKVKREFMIMEYEAGESINDCTKIELWSTNAEQGAQQ